MYTTLYCVVPPSKVLTQPEALFTSEEESEKYLTSKGEEFAKKATIVKVALPLKNLLEQSTSKELLVTHQPWFRTPCSTQIE